MRKSVAWIIGALMIAGFLFFKTIGATRRLELGDFELTIPKGWREIGRIPDRVVIASPDRNQELTISTMDFNKDLNLEIFGKLCEYRLTLERKELQDGVISPESPKPLKRDDSFYFYLSTRGKSTGRISSTYMTFKGKEMLTIYLEGFGVTPDEHLGEFKAMISSLR